ncbi:hypothetical protein [Vibrio sp. 10N.261.51.F12]|uniref:hypothetical protein n=1 Tax=Vibrio sp. 10N.261.51.F12 TaxID=3229679 RepID=UPI00354C29D7
MEYIPEVITLIISLIVAVVTSYISVHLTLKRYKSEKWWDSRLTCYTDVLTNLSIIVTYSDIILDIKLDSIDHDKNTVNVLKSSFNEALINLQKLAHTGALLLDKESHKALMDYYTYQGHVETSCTDSYKLSLLRNAAEAAIDTITIQGKSTLL